MMWSHLTKEQTVALTGGTVAMALCVAALTRWILEVTATVRDVNAQSWEYESIRLTRLRKVSPCYRCAEPLVRDLARWMASNSERVGTQRLERIELDLERLGGSWPFTPEEYLATCVVKAILGVGMISLVAAAFLEPLWIALGLLPVFGLIVVGGIRDLRIAAHARVNAVKQQLPFTIDLLALMMGAGATFQDSLRTAVAESADNEAGKELAKLEQHSNGGRLLVDSLSEMGTRLRDVEVDEVVNAVRHAVDLGTPLADTFLHLAEQMRLRRTQRLEKIANQSESMMSLPNLFIMLGSLIYILGPIGLEAWRSSPF